MTLPYERTSAVLNTRQFLTELINPSLTPRVPARIRAQAKALLRHYPSTFDMERASEIESLIPDDVLTYRIFEKKMSIYE